MTNLRKLLYISLISIRIANTSEEMIDYIDTAQTQAYGMHCDKTDNSWRSIEIAEHTSTGNIVFNGINSFIKITDKIIDEMRKDLNTIVYFMEGKTQ